MTVKIIATEIECQGILGIYFYRSQSCTRLQMRHHGIQQNTRALTGWHPTQEQALSSIGDKSGFWHQNGRWQESVDTESQKQRHLPALEERLPNQTEFSFSEICKLLGDEGPVLASEYVVGKNGVVFSPRAAGLLICFDKRNVVPGTEWMRCKKSIHGRNEIQNDVLSARLSKSYKLSEAEVKKFNVGNVRRDSFIRVHGDIVVPVITNPGSKIYALFEVEEYIEEVFAQPENLRHFYEMIPTNKPASLYLDFDSVTNDLCAFMEMVKDAYHGLCYFQEFIFPCSGAARIQVYTSTSSSSGRMSKASIHIVCNSMHFKSNCEDKLMERFIFMLKDYIGDGGCKAGRGLSGEHFSEATEGVIDGGVYTKMRCFRSPESSKRGSQRILIKINVGEGWLIDENYVAGLRQKLSDDEFSKCIRADFRSSLVTVIDEKSKEVTHEHIHALEKMVERAKIGMHWHVPKQVSSKAVSINSTILSSILATRQSLRRHELNEVLKEMDKESLSKNALLEITSDEKRVVYMPYVQISKRVQNLYRSLKRVQEGINVNERLKRACNLNEHSKNVSATVCSLPDDIRRVFVGENTVVKEDNVSTEAFDYIRECVEMDLLSYFGRFYIQNPKVCPYDYCVESDTKKMRSHHSNNMYIFAANMRCGTTDYFAFCLDQQCRDNFLKKICALHSASSICNNVSGRLPSISRSPKQEPSFLQRFFCTPYQFQDLEDGSERSRLLSLYNKEPRVLSKLLSGNDNGRQNRLLYKKFLQKNGWVKLYRKRSLLIAPRD